MLTPHIIYAYIWSSTNRQTFNKNIASAEKSPIFTSHKSYKKPLTKMPEKNSAKQETVWFLSKKTKIADYKNGNEKPKQKDNFSNLKVSTNRKSFDFFKLKRKTKQKESFHNSSFKQTEKVPTFYKLKRKTKQKDNF